MFLATASKLVMEGLADVIPTGGYDFIIKLLKVGPMIIAYTSFMNVTKKPRSRSEK